MNLNSQIARAMHKKKKKEKLHEARQEAPCSRVINKYFMHDLGSYTFLLVEHLEIKDLFRGSDASIQCKE